MGLTRQPLVGPVVVNDEPIARVRGGGACWPPTELGPRDDPHQSLTLPTLVMLPSTRSHTLTTWPGREAGTRIWATRRPSCQSRNAGFQPSSPAGVRGPVATQSGTRSGPSSGTTL